MDSQPLRFGQMLRRRRHDLGMSQSELAAKVNYTKSYVSKVESGAKPPTVDLARRCDDALGADGALAAMVSKRSRGRIRPAQLPAAIAGFVGRCQQLASLDHAGPVAVITGPAGVGKTALALHWAHDAAARYPDGALFIDLRGHSSGPPTTVDDALDALLRSLDVPAERMPPQRSGRSALLRSLLAERRLLLLLDNAADSSQVRPLLPGAGRSAVLVTSRTRLPGIVARDGAILVPVPRFSDAEGIMLLERTIGSRRISAEPAAAAALIHQCGGLPLAIRIAAQRAHARQLSLAELTEQLSGGTRRLDMLTGDDEESSMRKVLSWSYQALPEPAARSFRLLCLQPGRETGLGSLAALLGSESAARLAASSLVNAHLVEETASGRLRVHDLLYAYGAERAAEDEPEPSRTAARKRMVNWYLFSAVAAQHMLLPGVVGQGDVPPADGELQSFGSYDDAFAWFESERTNLIGLMRQVDPESVWRMAAAMSAYFLHAKRWGDWTSTHELGLRAAEELGDEDAQARMLSSLGAAYIDQHRWLEGLGRLRRALALRQRTGEVVYQGYIINNIAQALGELGRHEESLTAYREAIAIFVDVDERYGLASAYNNLGWALTGLGRYSDAEPMLEESLRICQDVGYRHGQGMALDSLGNLYSRAGNTRLAQDYLQRAFALRAEIGDHHGMAMTEAALGDLDAARGDEAAARRRWRRALKTLHAIGAPQATDMLARLDRTGPVPTGKTAPPRRSA